MQSAFARVTDRRSESGCDLAEKLTAACDGVVEWLHTSPAPKGFESAEAELYAAAGVYRNAAVAFRRLAEATGEPDDVLVRACEALLRQGDHHVIAFLSGASSSDD
jgi:hypothetical protein